MKRFVYVLLLLMFCNFQNSNNSLESLIRKAVRANDWSLLRDFIGEEVKCEICIDKQVYASVQKLPNRTDTIHNYLSLFKKNLIITKELPELFIDTSQFRIESLYTTNYGSKNKNEFEVHVPYKNGVQIDLRFRNSNDKSKLVAIYETP